jgi:hypothetical protein
MDPQRLRVAFEAREPKQARIVDKHSLAVTDGKRIIHWDVASLVELFRGERVPPPDMDHYPEAYTPLFYFIESQLLTLCNVVGDRTDQELEEAYYALQRRPDGRNLGLTHDFLWQACALLLGCYSLSQAEFEALIGALVRSARRWAQRPVSRNCIAYLRNTFRGAG